MIISSVRQASIWPGKGCTGAGPASRFARWAILDSQGPAPDGSCAAVECQRGPMSSMHRRNIWWLFLLAVLLCMNGNTSAQVPGKVGEYILLRAPVADPMRSDPENKAKMRILEEFEKKYQRIKLVSTTGLQMPNVPDIAWQVVPLMQIAGGIAPHVIKLRLPQSDSYIRSKFLCPLDKYIEDAVGIQRGIPDGHLLNLGANP